MTAEPAVAATPLANGDDRRRDIRLPQGHRTIVLEVRGATHPLRLLNLSARGASGEVDAELRPGNPIVLTFENGLRVECLVRAATGPRIGVEFAEPIPLDVVEGEMRVDGGGRRRRYMRKPATYQVTLMVEGRPMDATVTDVSLGGVQVAVPLALVPGQQIVIHWSGGAAPDQSAQVRWTAGRTAGIMFATPVAYRGLCDPILEREPTPPAESDARAI